MPPASPIKKNRALDELRSQAASPRPETPEPESRQGRRNASAAGVQLLDDDGAISEQFESCLKHIFSKYCTPPPPPPPPTPVEGVAGLLVPPEGAYLSPEGLDKWATDTNGAPLNEDAKEELNFLDVTDEGYLTFEGFLQLYQLQTENDEEETWKDLSTHGFDRSLKLVTTRREDQDAEYVPSRYNSRQVFAANG
ncbi:hypothetical protein K474DRAFT_1590899 [Panus rudis PR-1116 ss-1]|nr:hypothetical protein K474DRAFT_1590899 [Panus rudis PR-1116 ss-1]